MKIPHMCVHKRKTPEVGDHVRIYRVSGEPPVSVLFSEPPNSMGTKTPLTSLLTTPQSKWDNKDLILGQKMLTLEFSCYYFIHYAN